MTLRPGEASNALHEVAHALGVAFTSETRLYELAGAAVEHLLVESFSTREALSELFEYRITVLATDAHLDLHALLGQQVGLLISLADGSRASRTGLVAQAAALQSDGGLARYELVVRPWLAILQLTQRSQSFVDKSIIEIAEALLQPYAPIAAWQWSPCVAQHLGERRRHYVNQFRETDFSFLSRLLAEEGIAWRYEEDDAAPRGHRVVFFAASAAQPEDPGSERDGGIRFHRASSQEDSDAVQAFTSARRLRPAAYTLTDWHYLAKRSRSVATPTQGSLGAAPRLEHYEPAGAPDHAGSPEGFDAERYSRLAAEAHEAHAQGHEALSTVRSLRPGTRFTLRDAPLAPGQSAELFITALTSAGINNLPKELNDSIARRLGPAGFVHELPAELRQQAQVSGYGNHFQCLDVALPWRARLLDDTGTRLNPKPSVLGPQTATVVGPHGETTPAGADEIYVDKLGRIKVQFHWQAHARHAQASTHSIWVRVAQPYAGPGMGQQFLPRIGQEVLVDFEELDVDRPVVIGTLHGGRGEGGVPATPGGSPAESDTSLFGRSTDHSTSGQGNLTGGHSPAWHGAAPGPDAQHNAAALSGFKTKEFGGEGYSQLVFDDTDQQLRVQAKTTQHSVHLNLGHLIHQADNHRGSFRGLGAELSTEAYGAIRAGSGISLSTYGIPVWAPAGDNAPAMAMSKQMAQLAQTFSDAAKTHETVPLAGHIGSHKAGQSTLDPQAAPLKALHKALSGTVAKEDFDNALADAADKHTQASDDKLPHTTDPVIVISAKAGFGLTAGQDVHLAAGEAIHTAAGQDVHHAVGGQARLHTGQAIGVLAGAVGPGSEAAGTGLTIIAAQGQVDVQAQVGPMQVAAKGLIDVRSKAAHIDWAAAKRIVLSTAGGASITIDANGIVTQCPGKVTVHAGKKSFTGPGRAPYPLPSLPQSDLELTEPEFSLRLTDVPGESALPLANTAWLIYCGPEPDGMATVDPRNVVVSGTSDAEGRIRPTAEQNEAIYEAYCRHPHETWLLYPGQTVRLNLQKDNPDWTEDQRLLHALSAADFSPDVHGARYLEAEQSQSSYAKQAADVLSDKALLKKLLRS